MTRTLTTDRIVTHPQVFVIGRQSLVESEMGAYLRAIGSPDWSTEAPCPGQALVEIGARACYRSFKAGRPHDDHLTNLLESGHGSCLEHCVFTLMVIGVSRSLTHEFVRHRVGLSYSQESQRYVNAADARVVPPPDMVGSVLDYIIRRRASAELGVDLLDAEKWVGGVEQSLSVYSFLAGKYNAEDKNAAARKTVLQAARSVLPNCLETRIQITGNARAWRHFLVLRGSLQADAEIRRLAIEVHAKLLNEAPGLFGDFLIHKDGSLASQYGSV